MAAHTIPMQKKSDKRRHIPDLDEYRKEDLEWIHHPI